MSKTVHRKQASLKRPKTKPGCPIQITVDVDTTLRMTKPELPRTIDRDRAADLGVDAADIPGSLRLMVGGDDEVSRFRDDKLAEDYDVEVRLTGVDRKDAGAVSKLYVQSRSGQMVRSGGTVRVLLVMAFERHAEHVLILQIDHTNNLRRGAGGRACRYC